MRKIISLNDNWQFFQDCATHEGHDNVQVVTLPHTWNAVDGHDGGNDYFRGSCLYKKTIAKADLPTADRYYLEIRGANSSADVYLNGEHKAHHDGGYSTWRVSRRNTDTVRRTMKHMLVVCSTVPMPGAEG